MPIVLVRVDDRLVHGQVLEGWLPSTGTEELVVANDCAALDEVQRMIMECSVPESTRIVIDTVDRVAQLLLNEPDSRVRRMVIVDHPLDALRLKIAGVAFNRLNLGNLRSVHGRICLSRSIVIGEESVQALREIVQHGVLVYIQSVPFEPPLACPEL